MARVRRLAHADYDPALLPERPRAYGGHPSLLVEDATVEWVQEQIRAGRPGQSIAEELGYATPSSFSDAYYKRTGERPSAYRDRVDAPKPRRQGANPSIQPRAIKDRTADKPLPRFDAKPKKRRKKRRSAKKRAHGT